MIVELSSFGIVPKIYAGFQELFKILIEFQEIICGKRNIWTLGIGFFLTYALTSSTPRRVLVSNRVFDSFGSFLVVFQPLDQYQC